MWVYVSEANDLTQIIGFIKVNLNIIDIELNNKARALHPSL